MTNVYLGTVAVEPNRWGLVDPSGEPSLVLSSVLDEVEAAGFDGIELWEKHIMGVPDAEADRVLNHTVAVPIWNSYVSFDDPDSAGRDAVAQWAERAGSTRVKFNVGNEADHFDAYADRLGAWLEQLPITTAALCECHFGISIAEDPLVAARLFDAADPSNRVQALVHTHDDDDLIRAKFDAFGDRITHIHVNFLDFANGATSPLLSDNRELFESKAALLESLGFDGSWTIEFVHGVMSNNDNPENLMASAIADVQVIREVLG